VRTVGRQPTPNPPLPDDWVCDLEHPPVPDGLLDGVECVVHCAGLAHQFQSRPDDAERFRRVNVDATVRLAEAALKAGVRRFVHVSSVSVYGPPPSEPEASATEAARTEDAPLAPVGPYAQSKRDAERELAALFSTPALDPRPSTIDSQPAELVVLRLATLYGEGDPGNVRRLIETIAAGRFRWVGRGGNLKSLLHRDDAARACVLAATRSPMPDGPRVYNVTAAPCPIRAVVVAIHQALGKRPPRWFVPGSAARGLLAAAERLPTVGPRAKRWKSTVEKWLAHDAYDGTRFARSFGFEPQVPLEDGIAREVFSIQPEEERMRIMGTLSENRNLKTENSALKRTFDVVLSLVLLAGFAVPMALIALAVRLTSKGPALHWSERVGRRNALFAMPKFRTMRTDTPQLPTHLLTDSRRWITPLGRFLRKTSLDELPQLWSILVGDMSFVGPRPALFNQDDLVRLRSELGVQSLRPGLTGWAQVNGRDELAIPEKVALDAEYLRHRSFLWDLKILFVTFAKVFRSEGVVEGRGKVEGSEPDQTPRRRAG
jgi:O-antigen biosynthesis protein WbqP